MADLDIQLGEVQHAAPVRRRRPDRDKHYAAAVCGVPADGDLPIFIDLDVLADVEAHAQSDTRVELGGVLLGGQYVDEDGRPFVVVEDSLRAEHYESSRGHFKFTHDTWTRISRQRDEFSEQLQMVGWYHTHPNWGVFLSGMDRFICDHFFNRPLDVALVIDPVRNERGWFCWKQDVAEGLPQTAGFHVITSRFRQRELAVGVAQLEGKTTMTTDSVRGVTPGLGPAVSSHIVHTIQPQLGWLGAAVLTLLALQTCLTLLVALRLYGDDRAKGPEAEQVARAERPEEYERQLATRAEKLERDLDFQRREARLDAERELFDKLLGHVKVGAAGAVDVQGLVEENHAQQKELARLTQANELLSEVAENHKALKRQHEKATARVAQLEQSVAERARDNAQLREELRQAIASRDTALADAEAARMESRGPPRPPTEAAEGPGDALAVSAASDDEPPPAKWSMAMIVGLLAAGVLAAAVLASVVIRSSRKRTRPQTADDPESQAR